MCDGDADNHVLQVIDMMVGIIRAARGFVDGAHRTVGANGPGRRERQGMNKTHGRNKVSGIGGLK